MILALVGVAVVLAGTFAVVAGGVVHGRRPLSYRGRDYVDDGRCARSAPARRSLRVINGARHVPGGDRVLASPDGTAATPIALFLWRGGRCVEVYDLSGGS